ncbi:serine hydrolase [Chitinophagaceae bacterium LB-8]|uniref:Serine hydrolase n=1 Tax=Paraflavisolibacter caeni TaxID=2982496 RepID=A0A9X2XWP6_9BACT|nr:serine hydrolase [Paraflavisolibacter caeni]MCU7550096.1 serine hydrolase [Paraflavisolibacter caeni]
MRHCHFSAYFKVIISSSILFITAVISHTVSAQTSAATISGYGKATYSAVATGKFMKNWLIAGPVPVSADSMPASSVQEKTFKEDIISSVPIVTGKPVMPVHVQQNTLQWKSISSSEDAVMLDKAFGEKSYDFVYAYAIAEIKAEKAGTVMLGLGSDDGVKVWLNGKLVHENWIPRGVQKDDDVVPLPLVRGSNQILIKVQDIQGGWGFVARLLDQTALSDQLGVAVSRGDLDKMNLLIDNGVDVNAKSSAGISPLVAAKIAGRTDIVQYLIKKGAKEEAVPDAATLIDTYYQSLKGKEMPGIAVLVSKDGKTVYERGFGYADIKGKKIVTPNTKFRIGSVTKQFTAAAILKLQEQGLLSVNDKLSKYIPDFPRGEEVTIHHLLTHTSGIHSYTNKPDFINKVTKTISEDSLIYSFKNDPYDFNPGENFMYNNSGYFLLGYIIEKVSGKSYGEYLKQTFFDPLQMKNTGVHYAGIKLEEEAHGYGSNNGKYDDAINWDMSWAGGAGALYSTLHDLDTWNMSLHSGKVLRPESLKAALTTVTLKNGDQPAMNYGYGLVTGKYRGIDYIEHSGGLHGFVSQLAYYPKEKLSVVMFSNTMTPEVTFDPNKIAEAYLWNEMEKETAKQVVSVPAEVLQRYTGRYDFMSAVMQVTLESDQLFAQLSGQAKFPIYPSSQTEFFWKVVDAKIKFIPDENGVVNRAEFRQNGQTLNVKKLKEDSIVTIDPVLLDQYTGKYKLNDQIVVTIIKENDKLFAQPTGQGKLEMFPVSNTEFVFKEINAKISFIKDENGKVNKAKLRMNGGDSELPRVE